MHELTALVVAGWLFGAAVGWLLYSTYLAYTPIRLSDSGGRSPCR
jgi:hypothetical protein